MSILSASLWLVTCLALGGGPVLAQKAEAHAAGKTAFDKPTLEAYVRHLFLWGPQITVKVDDPKPSKVTGFQQVSVTATAGAASQQEEFLVSKDGSHIIRGAVYDIAENPFKEDLSKLKTDLSPSFGAPGAPVVIVMFSDFECQYCKQEAKLIRENLAKTYPNDVRLYFKDFPLDSIHIWSTSAAMAGRCVFRQNPASFWEYHDWIFEHQGDINAENLKAKVLEFAGTKNLDTLMLQRCIDNKVTEKEVAKTVAEGKSLRVDSTPTMFVNGRKIPGSLAWAQLKQVIDFELDYQKTAANAGEKCCEVKLPTPLK